MSEPDRYEYGTSLCTVQENQTLVVEGCDPSSIVDELKAANFDRQGTRYIKKRSRLRRGRAGSHDEDDDLQVLSVRVIEDTLHVEPSDVVGVVSLLPGMSVQIEPKVDWDDVVQMLLTVYDIDRTQSHYGIPLDELTSGGIEASRVIAILAINYVHGLRQIRRKGLLRNLEIRRRDGFTGLGSIDMSRTLLNRGRGKLEPTWVETHAEYSNPVNETIHMAGKLLLRLLQQEHHGRAHPQQNALFSMVYQEVQQLEGFDIQSSRRELGTYRRVSIGDLPRQRHYYRRALYTAQSVLAATLLGQTGSGPEELLVDYALSMNALFEDYTQRVLSRALDSFGRIDHLDQLQKVQIEAEPPIYPFDGNTDATYYPDHLLTDDEDTLAVLDSKYYKEGKNPAHQTGSRSRMFSYAYLTSTERMAFLCPLYHRTSMVVNRPGATVDIVSPDNGFSCEAYESLIREYLIDVLAETYPHLAVFEAAGNGILSLDGVTTTELEDVDDPDGEFSIRNPSKFANRVLAGITFSTEGPNKLDLENGGQWTKSRIQDMCTRQDEEGRPRYPQDKTTCVPIYEPDGGGAHGTITLYFVRVEETGETDQVAVETESVPLL